jgi:adenylate kinase family enzyme
MAEMRILITGASGSGTTTLGRTLAESLNLPFFDVDDYYWAPTNPPFQQKRSAQERRSLLVEDLTMIQDGAVLAGSVVDWGAEIEDSFALIVFLIVAAEIRIPRLIKRETDRLGAPQKEFLEWAAQYDEGRLPGRSRAIHERWLSTRRCRILRIEGHVSVREGIRRILDVCLNENGSLPTR